MYYAQLFVSLQIVLKIEELIDLYARSPQSAALAKALGNVSIRNVFVEGLTASAAAVLFASVTRRTPQTILFILPDADEAGYFYQDLEQMLEAKPHPLSPSPKREGESYGVEKKGPTVLFFPFSYRRQVKYGQCDAANEILRTEVLARLSNTPSMGGGKGEALYIVTYPDALSELVTGSDSHHYGRSNIRVGCEDGI